MSRWLNRNVWGMTITSMLSDACYEMVLAVLPGFLPIIHVAAAALGWIEGKSLAAAAKPPNHRNKQASRRVAFVITDVEPCI